MKRDRRRLAVALAIAAVAMAALIVVWLLVSQPSADHHRDRAAMRALTDAEIQRLRQMPPRERAEGLWAAWKRCVEENWPEPWWHEKVIAELYETGDAGMDVLLDEIRNAPSHHTERAADFLSYYSPQPVDPLLQILDEPGDAVKHAALVGLYYQVLGYPLRGEQKERVRAAVRKMQSHPNREIRQIADQTLYRMSR